MNLDELKPGVELDRLVAEKVMGWESFTMGYWDTAQRNHYPYHESERQTELEGWLETVGFPELVGHYFIDVESDFFTAVGNWKPSIDIACAWRVIEYLREKGFTIYLFYNTESEGSYLWRVGFRSDQVWPPTGEAETAPLAICIAALKVMENES